MGTFDEREATFEKKFAHDAEMQFRAEARRNKLLGLWAAGLMGKEGDEAAAYALSVVSADLAEPGDEDVFRKVFADLQAVGADVDEPTLRARIAALLAEAKAQILEESDI